MRKFIILITITFIFPTTLWAGSLRNSLQCVQALSSLSFSFDIQDGHLFLPNTSQSFLIVNERGILSATFRQTKMEGFGSFNAHYKGSYQLPGSSRLRYVEYHRDNESSGRPSYSVRQEPYPNIQEHNWPPLDIKQELTPKTRKKLNEYILDQIEKAQENIRRSTYTGRFDPSTLQPCLDHQDLAIKQQSQQLKENLALIQNPTESGIDSFFSFPSSGSSDQ